MFHWFLLSSLILSKDHQQGTGKRIPCLFISPSLAARYRFCCLCDFIEDTMFGFCFLVKSFF